MKTLPFEIALLLVILVPISNEATPGSSSIASITSLSTINTSSNYATGFSSLIVPLASTIQPSRSSSHFSAIWPSISVTPSFKENASSHHSILVTSSAPSSSSTVTPSNPYAADIKRLMMIDSYVRSVDFCFAVLSLFVLVFMRLPKSSKFFVHKNLVLAIGIQDLCSILVGNGEILQQILRNKHTCAMMKLVNSYWHLTLFSWMAVEAFNICLMLSEVFDTRSKRRKHLLYLAIGYGSPALISVVIASVFWEKEFLRSANCQSFSNPWIFKGPAAGYISVNILAFLYIIGFTFRHIIASNKYKGGFRKFIGTIRSFLVLYPILGISQVIGFFIEKNIVVFGLLYIITTGFLAVLFFVFHELLDAQVMGAIKLRLGVRSDSLSTRTSNSRMTKVHDARSLRKVPAEVAKEDVIENRGAQDCSKL